MAKTPTVPDELAVAHDLILAEIAGIEERIDGEDSGNLQDLGRIDGLNTAMALMFRALVEVSREPSAAAARVAGARS